MAVAAVFAVLAVFAVETGFLAVHLVEDSSQDVDVCLLQLLHDFLRRVVGDRAALDQQHRAVCHLPDLCRVDDLPERRRVDEDVIEDFAGGFHVALKLALRKELRRVRGDRAAECDEEVVEVRRVEDLVGVVDLAGEVFRETIYLLGDAETGDQLRVADVCVDQEDPLAQLRHILRQMEYCQALSLSLVHRREHQHFAVLPGEEDVRSQRLHGLSVEIVSSAQRLLQRHIAAVRAIVEGFFLLRLFLALLGLLTLLAGILDGVRDDCQHCCSRQVALHVFLARDGVVQDLTHHDDGGHEEDADEEADDDVLRHGWARLADRQLAVLDDFRRLDFHLPADVLGADVSELVADFLRQLRRGHVDGDLQNPRIVAVRDFDIVPECLVVQLVLEVQVLDDLLQDRAALDQDFVIICQVRAELQVRQARQRRLLRQDDHHRRRRIHVLDERRVGDARRDRRADQACKKQVPESLPERREELHQIDVDAVLAVRLAAVHRRRIGAARERDDLAAVRLSGGVGVGLAVGARGAGLSSGILLLARGIAVESSGLSGAA